MSEIRVRLLIGEVINGSTWPAGTELVVSAEDAARLLNARAAELVKPATDAAVEAADGKANKRK